MGENDFPGEAALPHRGDEIHLLPPADGEEPEQDPGDPVLVDAAVEGQDLPGVEGRGQGLLEPDSREEPGRDGLGREQPGGQHQQEDCGECSTHGFARET